MGKTKADREYVTEVGYPEPDRGPLQVLRSPKPTPEPVPAGSPS
jgi:hypothetical protein